MKQRVALIDPPRVSESTAQFAATIKDKLTYAVGASQHDAELHDWFLATALALRDRILDAWLSAEQRARGQRRVYYLSIEYLTGRLLCDALGNMALTHPVRDALASLGIDLSHLRTMEADPALGSGGLGRLAACFMESMASLGIPAYGYGIRYEQGLFRQGIRDGQQEEFPDDWLEAGNPWEIERRQVSYPIRFGGAVEYLSNDDDTARGLWFPAEVLNAVAYDTPVVGWRGKQVNTLRLWSPRAAESIHLYIPHRSGYVGALAEQASAEAISQALYPNADTPAGQELRLRQEYFFTSASLQDIIQRHLAEQHPINSLPAFATIQMNDTHPTLAVAELMRLLIDEHNVSWSEAWRITTSTLNYTNHTLLPEAFETWPVDMMNRLLPRHMQIIFLINWHHLQAVDTQGASGKRDLAALSLIHEDGDRRVRMGHLAFVGSRKINGVSALHTRIMRDTVFKDLDECYPNRIVNKTNGITFRRWLFGANPRLTRLLVDLVGKRVLDDPTEIQKFEQFADNQDVHRALSEIRQHNKRELSHIIRAQTGLRPNPAALFDVQIKRIHEYKRQLLNIMEAVALYHSIHAEPHKERPHRLKIFAGKAAMNYVEAKLIIRLANDVAHVINSDPVIGDQLKIAFLANYNVSLAESIVPAADLSEQISTAGLEASGTGNMKLALNGALTIGTLDGANVEIRENVGEDNIFIFGLKADEVTERLRNGFAGRDAINASPLLAESVKSIATGMFSPDEPDRYKPLIDRLLGNDAYMVAADFDSYWLTQRRVDARWIDQTAWWRSSVLNTARMGWFSSDRAIREYAEDIWNVPVNPPPMV